MGFSLEYSSFSSINLYKAWTFHSFWTFFTSIFDISSITDHFIFETGRFLQLPLHWRLKRKNTDWGFKIYRGTKIKYIGCVSILYDINSKLCKYKQKILILYATLSLITSTNQNSNSRDVIQKSTVHVLKSFALLCGKEDGCVEIKLSIWLLFLLLYVYFFTVPERKYIFE